MKISSKIELKLEDFDKCFTIVDSDCPIGQIYDYTCALRAFVFQKMQDAEAEVKKQQTNTQIKT
jgi:hypothetical protein